MFLLMVIGAYQTIFAIIPGTLRIIYRRSIANTYDSRIADIELIATDFGGDYRFHEGFFFNAPRTYATDLQITDGIPSYVQIFSQDSWDEPMYNYYLSTPSKDGIERLSPLLGGFIKTRDEIYVAYTEIADPLNGYRFEWSSHIIYNATRVNDQLVWLEGRRTEPNGLIDGSDTEKYPYQMALLDTSASTIVWHLTLSGDIVDSYDSTHIVDSQIAVVYDSKIDVYSLAGELTATWNPFSTNGKIKYEDGYLWNFIYPDSDETPNLTPQVELINTDTGELEMTYPFDEGMTLYDGILHEGSLYFAGSILENNQTNALVLILDVANLNELNRLTFGGSHSDYFHEIEVFDNRIYTLGRTNSYDTDYFYDPLLVPYIPWFTWLPSKHYQDFYMAIEHP